MPRKKGITIKEVAQRAKVSIATVSYAFNRRDAISAETRARVFAAAEELGYRPNVMASNLRRQESRILGYSWHPLPKDHWHPVLDRFLYAMAAAAEARGYHILTFTGGSGDEVWQTYEALMLSQRVDGFVLSDTNADDVRIRGLLERGFPFVAFGRANEAWDFPYVDVDGEAGVAQAVEHLLELGHRRIGLVTWPQGSLTGRYRNQGYRRTLAAAGLSVDPAWIVRGENDEAAARAGAQQLLALPEERRPTAIVAVSDLMALGVMRALYSAGLQPGQDVAVVGYDDIPTAQYLQPPLSSVRQPIVEVGERVVEMLLQVIAGEPLEARRVLLEPELIVRASSGGPVSF
ncbi:MAG: LacI family DNA-binding transcriptional regulator [Anaerolineae bacterium]